MRGPRGALAALACAVSLAGLACVRASDVHPPPGWLAACDDASDAGYGAWGLIESRAPGRRRTLQGELIAVEIDSTYVLTTTGLETTLTRDLWDAVLVSCLDKHHHAVANHVGGLDWAEMKAFARFPQGLPAGVDPRTLEGRK